MQSARRTPEELAKEINSVMGEGTLRFGSDPSLEVKYRPTGVLPFDHLLGGGIPTGRFIEIFGDASALKSYIGLKAIAQVQQAGGIAALVDTEHAYDPEWAEKLGVDTKNLLVQHPPTGEAAVKITEVLIRNKVDLIVWDSVAATIPKAYQEAKPGEDEQPARLAALMSKALQRLNSANTVSSVMFINQTRVNVGITFGAKDATPGGKALGYYASLRIRFVKAGRVTKDIKIWDGEKWNPAKEATGQKIKMTLEKSKLSAPYREAWFVFDLASGGVDDIGYLIAQGLEKGLIEAKGAWWYIPQGKAQGQTKFRQFLMDNPEAAQWMRTQIMASSTGYRGRPKRVAKKTATPRRSAASKG